jgi:hypothetical protein
LPKYLFGWAGFPARLCLRPGEFALLTGTPRMQFAILIPRDALFLDRPCPNALNSLADG